MEHDTLKTALEERTRALFAKQRHTSVRTPHPNTILFQTNSPIALWREALLVTTPPSPLSIPNTYFLPNSLKTLKTLDTRQFPGRYKPTLSKTPIAERLSAGKYPLWSSLTKWFGEIGGGYHGSTVFEVLVSIIFTSIDVVCFIHQLSS